MNLHIITLGCKVNQYESQAICAMMAQCGFTAQDTLDGADVIVLNSCTVTGTSDQKVRQTLRRARRRNPDAVLVLTGCMPQAFPAESAQLLGDADIVVGNANRRAIPALVLQFLRDRAPILQIEPHTDGEAFESLHVRDFHDRTRAFVKIEDGCNRFCSYCIIPYARGRVRSKPMDALRAELAQIAAAGYRETVLVGINLSAYGQDLGLHLGDAADAAAAAGLARIRLGSLEPDRMTDELLDHLAREPKFCPQFHLSMQSGCTETLRRMNRHYTAPEYADIVRRIRARFAHPSITTDWMVGFAGETDAEFAESMRFVESVGFAKVHVFPYSQRPGTVADRLPNQVPPAVKEARTHQALALADRLHRAFLESQIGRTADVLIETSADGWCSGFTPDYAPVRVRCDAPLHNQICRVRIDRTDGTSCVGTLTDAAHISE